MKTPREDQRDCIRALRRDFAAGLNRLAIVLPTGTGKGFVLGMATQEFAAGRRVLVLANSEELLDQIKDTVRDLMPRASIGWVQGTRNDLDSDIVLAMIQSMSPARCAQFGDIGLILVDETHYAMADSWMRVLSTLGVFDGVRLIGFTATFVRNDSRGLGDLYQKVSYQKDLAWAIREGHVLPFKRMDVLLPSLDLRAVDRTEDGEYDADQVGALLADPAAAATLAQEFKQRAGDKRGIVFVPTKRAAHAVGAAFTAAGITNAVITGDTPRDERKEIYAAARRGEIQALINVGVLIAGFDDQGIWVVMIATMTKAQSRLTQMGGRAMRVDRSDPTKREALVIVMKGVEAEIATIVDLKRTGAKPPAKARKSPAKGKKRPAAVAGQYKARRHGADLVVTRLSPDGPAVIDRRPMPTKAKEVIALIVKIDRAQRSLTSR